MVVNADKDSIEHIKMFKKSTTNKPADSELAPVEAEMSDINATF